LIEISILRKALDFYLKASTSYQVKSPIVKKIIKEVIENDRHYYALGRIITLRERLRQNQQVINHRDYGAGSKVSVKEKTVGSFVKHSASSEKKGKILFNLARHFNPKKILELGTNVGIGTAYLASANSKSQVETIEACPELCKVAKQALSIIGISNANVHQGKFTDQLEEVCKKLGKIDLVFIDGDHSYEGTVKYFKRIKPFLHKKSIIVFDDIYWSDGMKKAWNEIKADSEISLCIDVFRLGIIFFDKELPKEDLRLIAYPYKFWKRF